MPPLFVLFAHSAHRILPNTFFSVPFLFHLSSTPIHPNWCIAMNKRTETSGVWTRSWVYVIQTRAIRIMNFLIATTLAAIKNVCWTGANTHTHTHHDSAQFTRYLNNSVRRIWSWQHLYIAMQKCAPAVINFQIHFSLQWRYRSSPTNFQVLG